MPLNGRYYAYRPGCGLAKGQIIGEVVSQRGYKFQLSDQQAIQRLAILPGDFLIVDDFKRVITADDLRTSLRGNTTLNKDGFALCIQGSSTLQPNSDEESAVMWLDYFFRAPKRHFIGDNGSTEYQLVGLHEGQDSQHRALTFKVTIKRSTLYAEPERLQVVDCTVYLRQDPTEFMAEFITLSYQQVSLDEWHEHWLVVREDHFVKVTEVSSYYLATVDPSM